MLGALRDAGVDAFPAYGTLLGAVRDGKLIGHDSDADLGYVSHHTHPVDVIRESFRLQRALADMGYRISRYSGAAFKVDVHEADGRSAASTCSAASCATATCYLMGEIARALRARRGSSRSAPPRSRAATFPAPADTDRLLTATYGPGWRVPDPAFKFATPASTHPPAQRLVPRHCASAGPGGTGYYSRTPSRSPEPSPLRRECGRRARARPRRRTSTSAAVAAPTSWFAAAGCPRRVWTSRPVRLRAAAQRRAEDPAR